ncbi:MAG: cupin domain-containing protein [Proteobacteria bacterium]|nr:cupin domain-containing protein [Pseudomonadota bacterium]MCP4917610.1 cupin domain-containing protein [Pseudomonadota bacterium]
MQGVHVEPLTVFEDARGALIKASPGPVAGEVYVVTIQPGASRGHHRHHRMGEVFVALSGQGCVGVTDGEKTEHIDLAGQRVHVGAGVAHALFNTGDELLIVLAAAERIHDPDDVEACPVGAP